MKGKNSRVRDDGLNSGDVWKDTRGAGKVSA
jgi:hypothetical protein